MLSQGTAPPVEHSLGTAPRIVVAGVTAAALILGAASPLTLLVLPYAAVGLVLAARRPSNAIGWILCGVAIASAAAGWGWWIAAVGLPSGWTGIVQSVSGTVSLGLLFLLTIIFPSGRLPGGRWGTFVRALLALWTLDEVLHLLSPTIQVGGSFVPNPLGVIPASAAFDALTTAFTGGIALALFVSGMSSMIARFRSSMGVERAQLKWVLASLATVAIGFALGFLGAVLVGDRLRDAGWVVFSLAAAAYPLPAIAVGVAVLRYRLYEIDRIINRAVVYGALTAILAGVFAAGAGVAERLFIALTGQSSDAAPAVATLVVVTLYSPLRKSLEAIVDRRMKYGEHRFGQYREELEREFSLADPLRAARRLALEASRELEAKGCAVVDADDRPTASAGEWPLPVEVRLAIPGGHGSLTGILLGARRDGRPHDPRALAQLSELSEAVVDAVKLHTAPSFDPGGRARSPARRVPSAEHPPAGRVTPD